MRTNKTFACYYHHQDEATDIILTLGEAFEVAFQVGLREQKAAAAAASAHKQSHSRTRSECPPRPPIAAKPTNTKPSHAR